MYEKRKTIRNPQLNAIVLNSDIGETEKQFQWERFQAKFASETNLKLIETTNPLEADFAFIATGGAEHLYLSQRNIMPSAICAPRGTNAFAALNEIRGFMQNQSVQLLCAHDIGSLHDFAVIARSKRYLDTSELSLFGAPAPWLVASIPNRLTFEKHFKTRINFMSWEDLNWPSTPINPFLENIWLNTSFNHLEISDLSRACQLSSAMLEWAQTHLPDAIAVGCFPLLSKHVSACLAVSDLLDAGYIAACENDICSAMAMLIADYLGLATIPPWMANLVDYNQNEITIQHCTIGKSGLKTICLMTHFESGANAAVAGTLHLNAPVTIFRFNDTFSKAFIAEGKIIQSGPNPDGCRTSATIALPNTMTQPLGNHHILIQGHHADILAGYCQMMNIHAILNV